MKGHLSGVILHSLKMFSLLYILKSELLYTVSKCWVRVKPHFKTEVVIHANLSSLSHNARAVIDEKGPLENYWHE
jgi:hypothetical protein